MDIGFADLLVKENAETEFKYLDDKKELLLKASKSISMQRFIRFFQHEEAAISIEKTNPRQPAISANSEYSNQDICETPLLQNN